MLTKLTGKQLKQAVNEAAKHKIPLMEAAEKILFEDFQDIYEYYTDLVDQYANQFSDGEPLSPDQIEQLEEIRDYLVDTYANDNAYTPSWIALIDDMIKGDRSRFEARQDMYEPEPMTEQETKKYIARLLSR